MQTGVFSLSSSHKPAFVSSLGFSGTFFAHSSSLAFRWTQYYRAFCLHLGLKCSSLLPSPFSPWHLGRHGIVQDSSTVTNAVGHLVLVRLVRVLIMYACPPTVPPLPDSSTVATDATMFTGHASYIHGCLYVQLLAYFSDMNQHQLNGWWTLMCLCCVRASHKPSFFVNSEQTSANPRASRAQLMSSCSSSWVFFVRTGKTIPHFTFHI